MSPVQMAADLLRRLPSSVRRTLYTVLALLGLALTAAQFLGVESIGSVSMSRALELYAYISPAMGVVAVANVSKPADEEVTEFEEDVDLSAFEPVGSEEDVYGAAAL
ncbi:MAG: hypothetical protein ABWX84_13045 [Nocardioides sp.]